MDHCTDIIRLCRRGNLGVRYVIPFLNLRLDLEQECYAFLKWWATNLFGWGDVNLPHVDIRNADAFEPMRVTHLVVLTLLKLRLYLDLDSYEWIEAQSRYCLSITAAALLRKRTSCFAHVRRAWVETDGIMSMIDGDTAVLGPVYKGLGSVVDVYSSDFTGRRKYAAILCLEQKYMFAEIYGSPVLQIHYKAASVRLPAAAKDPLELHRGGPLPPGILVVDGAIARHRKLLFRIIDLLHVVPVVVAGCFGTDLETGELERTFTTIGLPRKRGSYGDGTLRLRRGAAVHISGYLSSAYTQRAQVLANVEESAVWYVNDELPHQASATTTKVGKGTVGYIGDVNTLAGSMSVIMALCGLRVRLDPGLKDLPSESNIPGTYWSDVP
ncbi:hypothetical protein PpBr36_09031 [Pyricularia pennisetigena]|uniref:hypothetical protein n=1 Tax=Pyricularia pennisetigena TaxID=1578925 RepID=UPI00114E34E6|nr:hypothetical protein PpBr36_09031 [Pyricularia pennisetigena]TLS23816.1 hypothetical protein PpBr36_09031 [Pyricularia pennisetigena]